MLRTTLGLFVLLVGLGLGAGIAWAEWDGAPPAPLPVTMHPDHAIYDAQVHSRHLDTLGDNSVQSMMAQHGPDCSAPPATHEVHSYSGTVFICANHIMTAMNAPGYGEIVLTPAKLLNCSAGCTVQWDMSTDRMSKRDLPDV